MKEYTLSVAIFFIKEFYTLHILFAFFFFFFFFCFFLTKIDHLRKF